MDNKTDKPTTSPSASSITPSEPPSAGDAVGGAITGIGHQLRRGIDRMSFEADKRLRAGRVRSEIIRLQKQAADIMEQVAERVLELEAAGAEIEPTLKNLVNEVRGLRRRAADMATEIEAIHAEQWIEPATPVLPAPTQAPVREAGKSARPTRHAVHPTSDAGTSEPTTCPVCGGPLRPMSAFCPNCGHKL